MRISRPSSPKCGRCKRDLLVGEETFLYLRKGDEEPVHICRLCVKAAESEGWVRISPREQDSSHAGPQKD